MAIGTPSSSATNTGGGSVTITYDPVADACPTIPVTVTGSQTYGGTPSFNATYTAPTDGSTVSGTATCTTVNGGTPISSTLTAGGTYTIDGSSC